MSEPIRVLHFSDLHVGMEAYGRLDPVTGLNRRVIDFLDRLDEVVQYALEHEADLVLFAGDAFRTRTPTPTQQREFAQRIRRITEAAIPVVLLVGNHDVPVMSQRASSVEIYNTLAVPYVTVASQPELLRLETRRGVVQVAVVPYPVRQRLLSREQYRHLSQEELDREVSRVLVELIEELASKIDPALPAMLLGHFSVDIARLGSERSIMVGRDVAVPVSALTNPVWDYVALGHIHLHQDLNPAVPPPVVYAGSLERVDFGEQDQPKGFCWIELQRGAAAWRYVELATRPFVTLRVDARGVTDPLEAIRQTVAGTTLDGAVVRLIIRMTPEQEPSLRDADLLPLLGTTFFAQINRDVDRAIRDRLEGLDPGSMTPEHLLRAHLLGKGHAEAELEEYLRVARELMATPDDGDS